MVLVVDWRLVVLVNVCRRRRGIESWRFGGKVDFLLRRMSNGLRGVIG